MSPSDIELVKQVGDRMLSLLADEKLDPMFRVYAGMARACILQGAFDLPTRLRVAQMLSGFDWSRGQKPTGLDRAEIVERLRLLEETFGLA